MQELMKSGNTPLLFPYDPVEYWQNIRQIIREEVSKMEKEKPAPGSLLDTPGLTHKPLLKISELCTLTLKTLEPLYAKNEVLRQGYKIRVKNSIDLALRKPVSIPDLKELLRKEGIALELRQNAQGVLYGITYIDHRNQCVFNGSDLGKEYSAKAIQERCLRQIEQPKQTVKQQQNLQQKSQHQTVKGKSKILDKKATPQSGNLEDDFKQQAIEKAADLLTTLTQQEQTDNQMMPEWLKRQKKRKHRHRL
jgi:hypothetical protein